MFKELVNQHYYLICVAVMLIAFAVFFFSYEKKKPEARELVTLAVLSAIAVASRAAFAMIPFFKPMLGIIMITGMAFGAGAGFLTGAVSGFVSNFFFGQGPWTPWQMFAYGVGGALAGFLYRKGVIHEDKRLFTSFTGYLIVQLLVGPVLDACAVFTMGQNVSGAAMLAILGSGVIPNAIHGLATFLTLFLLGRPMMEKLNRIRLKYGMMETDHAL